MENKVLKSVQNVAIGFFTLIFIMGFFSKSIENMFLPKVQVQACAIGMVSRTLDIEGEIKAKNTVKIRLSEAIIVEEYLKKPGDEVTAGETIFKVDPFYVLQSSGDASQDLKRRLNSETERLRQLQSSGDITAEKAILIQEARLKASKEELAKQEELYEAGAITQSELDILKSSIHEQTLNLEISQLQLDEKKKENLSLANEVQSNIAELQKQLAESEKKLQFYSNIGADGSCISPIDGVILNINQAKVLLPQDVVIVEIAEKNDEQQYIYDTKVSEMDAEFLEIADKIEIAGENDQKHSTATINYIGHVDTEGMVEIQGIFDQNLDLQVRCGQRLKGEIKKARGGSGCYTVPISAVIPDSELKDGGSGVVYLMIAEQGILGTERIAREIAVKMLAVGDDSVAVIGLEGYESPAVIVNPSYKLHDGTKVFLWQ